MMKSLVLANQKGGVGKSAIGTQLAFYAAHIGKRVLYIDLDHQRNSTNPLIRSKLCALAAFSASDLQILVVAEPLVSSFVLVRGDERLSGLEPMPETHNAIANNLAKLLHVNASQFDIAIIDTNPNPDIRYGVALVVADYVLSPVQLNLEALEGIGALLNHSRYGIAKIRQAINAKLELIGILPNSVEATPFQRANLLQLAEQHSKLLLELAPGSARRYAMIPKRTAIAEAQAEGAPLYAMKKTSARDAWIEVQPVFDAVLTKMGFTVKGVDHGA